LSFAASMAERFDELEFCDDGFHGLDLSRESGMIRRRRLPLRIASRGESGQVEERAEVRIVVAKVG
jgi:hypothetical protein